MDSLPEHIAELIRNGRKIEAIKMLRLETGVDLKTAKEAVDRLDTDPAFDPLPVPERPEDVSEEVKLLAYQGQFLPAIRLLLRQTGLGLKEAKEMVEQLRVDPSLPPRRSASLFVIMAIAIALLGLGMAFAVFFAQA